MSTNDLTEEKITDFVLDTLKQTPEIRTKQIMEALVRHLHAFIREIEPSEAEWMTGVKFLTTTGKMRRDGETAMRALMRTDEEGRFWFRSVLPTAYPIPDDGPVGAMMRATGRNSIRPAHVHIRVDAPGFQRLTTMLFVDGDAHIASDPVFGVKDGLIHQFELP